MLFNKRNGEYKEGWNNAQTRILRTKLLYFIMSIKNGRKRIIPPRELRVRRKNQAVDWRENYFFDEIIDSKDQTSKTIYKNSSLETDYTKMLATVPDQSLIKGIHV